MTERIRNSPAGYYQQESSSKMNDFGPKKTMFILVIVVGCFAVLWPKVFYPMLVGSANQHMKPSAIDKTAGCCDVISDTDVNTIKILSELCSSIIHSSNGTTPSGKEIVYQCKSAVLETCGIDISEVLQDKVRLGHSVKQILDEIRSLNGSLCLKYNFGVAPWKLGVPHRVTVKVSTVRQERPPHLRSEMVHPAFKERGRAIPHLDQKASRPPPKIIEGRPGPIPGMRPPMGGAGHVVPPPQKGTSSMSVIMPIYTIGIVIFFTYTLMKLLFKKQPDGVGGSMYPPVEPDRSFRRDVFESERSQYASRMARDGVSSKLVVNAMSALLDEVDQEMELRRKACELASQAENLVNGGISNANATKPEPEQDQTSVKVLGMEMTASCEGGQKWSRPGSPVVPVTPPLPPEPTEPPQEIYLEGALPAQSQLLVADSATEAQSNTAEDPAVVLAGKMTLSVISLDQENGKLNISEDIEDAMEISKYTTAENDISEEDEEIGKDEPIDEIEEIRYDYEDEEKIEENIAEESNGLQKNSDLIEITKENSVEKEIEQKEQDREEQSFTHFEVRGLQDALDEKTSEEVSSKTEEISNGNLAEQDGKIEENGNDLAIDESNRDLDDGEVEEFARIQREIEELVRKDSAALEKTQIEEIAGENNVIFEDNLERIEKENEEKLLETVDESKLEKGDVLEDFKNETQTEEASLENGDNLAKIEKEIEEKELIETLDESNLEKIAQDNLEKEKQSEEILTGNKTSSEELELENFVKIEKEQQIESAVKEDNGDFEDKEAEEFANLEKEFVEKEAKKVRKPSTTSSTETVEESVKNGSAENGNGTEEEEVEIIEVGEDYEGSDVEEIEVEVDDDELDANQTSVGAKENRSSKN